ncbi:cell division protein FtsL [Cytobacillus spongiae]|jgi:cell division protein FtsL|uniref:cell division protein FtsL n=1 Tax=Cytobacillus spongiae TaxID=2901381 RepID=UPI001F1C3974|nr:cell division protein FtsL [Cytobacillus spongiae]UII57312.1 cell division protein FtsL [Cytobacillus spongiae]
MSNLARKLQQEEKRQQQSVQAPKKQANRMPWLSPGEKVLGLLFGAILCIGSVNIISNQTAIYKVNKDIHETKASIDVKQRENNDLEMQVSELSAYERIKAKAEELGLKLNDNNVKVVQE